MTEESRAVKRARKSEERLLGYAVSAYRRYLRAVEYRKLVQGHEKVKLATAELDERIKALDGFAELLRQDVEAANERAEKITPIMDSEKPRE